MKNTPEEYILKLESKWSRWSKWQGERGRFIKGNPGRRKKRFVSIEVSEIIDTVIRFNNKVEGKLIPKDVRRRYLKLLLKNNGLMRAFRREAPDVFFDCLELFIVNCYLADPCRTEILTDEGTTYTVEK